MDFWKKTFGAKDKKETKKSIDEGKIELEDKVSKLLFPLVFCTGCFIVAHWCRVLILTWLTYGNTTSNNYVTSSGNMTNTPLISGRGTKVITTPIARATRD